MSIDSRLRDGLHRSMSAIDTDAERHLDDAHRRGNRRIVIRRVAAFAAVVLIVATIALTAPAITDLIRDLRDRAAKPPTTLPITGTYTTTITSGDATDPTAEGTWLLSLEGGTLDLASLTNGGIARSVSQYQVTGREFLTSALGGDGCSGIGRYATTRTASSLTFELVSDSCQLRIAIFTSRPWRIE